MRNRFRMISLALIRDRMAAGHGGFPLTGTPEQVADGIAALHAAGFRGTTLSFVDYVEEFPYFRDNVLPLLEQRGIRIAQTRVSRRSLIANAKQRPSVLASTSEALSETAVSSGSMAVSIASRLRTTHHSSFSSLCLPSCWRNLHKGCA